jgi:hypothetical protein
LIFRFRDVVLGGEPRATVLAAGVVTLLLPAMGPGLGTDVVMVRSTPTITNALLDIHALRL